VTLSLFDSRAQTVREFQPITPGKVGIYLCGPTVQGLPHVGHLRSALVYDQLRRWLQAKGLEVTLVRNVTDIDDKVLENAQRENEPWWGLAYRFELSFNQAYSALGILPPTYEPRATGAVPEMLELIDRLIENGYAYQADDGSANVYFAASKWAEYGALTNQRVDDMDADADAELRGKRSQHDFALWKARKSGEPESASWATKFGAGRPGWHIECSAMATKYLGSNFDIHGGGLDLRFPHHENELAQSSAAGDAFAKYWLHNGLVNVNGQKMSKSLGNSIFAADLIAAADPAVVRYYLGSAHYRSVLDYHDGVLEEAATAFGRIQNFLARAERIGVDGQISGSLIESLPQAFIAAMDDDLAIPVALGVLHETVREGNAALDAAQTEAVSTAAKSVRAMLEVLGLNPDSSTSAGSAHTQALDILIQELIAQRNAARAAKDFAQSDAIRDQLKAAGISIEDAADGTHWSVK
jgi:cysteinyl-tRNA synthetase